MTTNDLSWAKTKDALVLGIGAVLVAILGFLLKGQVDANQSLAEIKVTLARSEANAIALEKRVDRMERYQEPKR